MRVYMFDVRSGIYAGEDFCDENEIREEDGITTIAPPVAMPGHVAVYDPELGNWKLMRREGLEEKNG
jgi:hypothetical protein